VLLLLYAHTYEQLFQLTVNFLGFGLVFVSLFEFSILCAFFMF